VNLPNLGGETPVLLVPWLRHDGRVRLAFGKLYAHCADCAKTYVDNFNSRFAFVQTEPTCLLDKASGELIDLPPVSAAPAPALSRWRFPSTLPYQETHMLIHEAPPADDPKPDDDKPKDDDKKPADDE
jgi:hypothetical protein